MSIRYRFYRWTQVLMHKFDLHYAPIHGPFEDGRKQRWCQWCGMRDWYVDPLVSVEEIRQAAKQLGIARSQALHADTKPALNVMTRVAELQLRVRAHEARIIELQSMDTKDAQENEALRAELSRRAPVLSEEEKSDMECFASMCPCVYHSDGRLSAVTATVQRFCRRLMGEEEP